MPRPEKLLYRAGALAVDGRTDRAVAAYDELVTRYDADPDPETRRVVALALFAKALALAKADRCDEAITACEVAIARYRDTSVPELSDRVIEALYNRAVCLDRLRRVVEAMDGYDDAIACYRAAPREGARDDYLGALVNKAASVEDLGRPGEALAAYEQVIDDHGRAAFEALDDGADPATTYEQHLHALLYKARALAELGRPEQALDGYQRVVSSYRSNPAPPRRELAVSALRDSSVLLSDLVLQP